LKLILIVIFKVMKKINIRLSVSALSILFTLVSLNAQVKFAGYNDWFTAYHDAIICVDHQGLQPGLITYPAKPDMWLRQQVLGKASFALERDGTEFLFHHAGDARWIPENHGFRLTGTVEGVFFNIECVPVIHGRESPDREGAAIFKTNLSGLKKGDQIVVNYGGLARGGFVLPHVRYELLASDGFECAANNSVKAESGMAVISSPDLSVIVGVKGLENGKLVPFVKHPDLNVARAIFSPDKSKTDDLYVIVGFAEEEKKLNSFLPDKPGMALQETTSYFEDIVRIAAIKTPVHNIDETFKWGVLCLEYCYYQPLGWIESLDHWLTLYSMMYPRVADHLGQTTRSKLCLLEHGRNIDPTGRINNLCPSGKVRNDFLWNHHFLWDVEHYLDKTGDLNTIRELYEPTKRVFEQTFNTYDKDKNLLIGFDQQIGYQEDFVNTPNDGGSAGMAGIEMLRIMSVLAEAIGNEEDTKKYAQQEKIARATLDAEIWDTGLGRYLYYVDHYGIKHWDGQYHTFSWPSMYGFSDMFGKYTSLRYMKERLISPSGLIYVSNNFPEHVAHTTGCQEGAPQTPIAAQAFSAGGFSNEGGEMFEAFADLVMAPQNLGCFPETAQNEGTSFSPTASFYLEGIIEGLFGIRWRDRGQVLTLAPSLPDTWPQASISLPDIELDILQTETSREMNLRLNQAITTSLEWILPPANSYKVTVNGKTVQPQYKPAVKGIKMNIDLPKSTRHTVKVDFSPLEIYLEYPATIKEGTEFQCHSGNSPIIGIRDPSGLLTSVEFNKNKAELILAQGLMKDFMKFGSLAGETFSRRTFFVKLDGGEQPFYWPVDIKVEQSVMEIELIEQARTGQSFSLPFPKNQTATDWKKFRIFDATRALGLNQIVNPLQGLKDMGESLGDSIFRIKSDMGQVFDFHSDSLLVVSDNLSTPSVTFHVDKEISKMHFLVLSYVNNKDVFADEVGQIIVRCNKPEEEQKVAICSPEPHLVKQTLCYPGNIDNWMPISGSHGYHSAGRGWSTSPVISTEKSVFSIITIDLNQGDEVESITINSVGRMPALGIVAITAEK